MVKQVSLRKKSIPAPIVSMKNKMSLALCRLKGFNGQEKLKSGELKSINHIVFVSTKLDAKSSI